MPKCCVCDVVVHPDMCVEVDEFSKACKCVWCYTDKKEITIEDESGKPQYTITKAQAAENYRVYLKKLSESEKIQKIMMKGQENPFKI